MLKFSLMLLGWCAADLLFWRIAFVQFGLLRRRLLWQRLLAAFIAVQLGYLVYLFVRMIIESLTGSPPVAWSVLAYLWHLVFLPVAIIGLWLGVVGKGTRRILSARSRSKQASANAQPDIAAAEVPTLTRRQALTAAALALPSLATVAITPIAVARLSDFRVRRCELRLPSLPIDLDGLTIAHVTDLHIGRFLPRGMRERVADATNALDADLIAFTGDVNDISMSQTDLATDFLRRLRSRYGMAMIEGNHDVMTDTERFEGPMLSAGLPLLLDAAMTIRVPGRPTPVQFMGIHWGEPFRGSEIGRSGKDARRLFRRNDDRSTAESVARVVALREPGAFPILLAHHPHAFDPATAAGLPLVLSGHTHGGQIMLNDRIGVGPLRFRYWSGMYRKNESQLVVANGVGNWFPFRVNAPAEIVHLTLRRGAASS